MWFWPVLGRLAILKKKLGWIRATFEGVFSYFYGQISFFFFFFFLLIIGLIFTINCAMLYWSDFYIMTLAQPIVNNSEKSAMKQKEEMVFCFQNCSGLMWEKNILVIKQIFCKFKAEEFLKQNIFSNLLIEVSTDWNIGTIRMPTGTNNRNVEI